MKSIIVHYLSETNEPIEKVMRGSHVGYDAVGENLFKAWADRDTFIVPIDRLLYAYMED